MSKTITALATPPGVSGLAVIRISGKDAVIITDRIFNGRKKLSECSSHTIHYGKIIAGDTLIDSVTVSLFLEPNSYTGENVVEIGCHGGQIVYREILDALVSEGAVLAEPGEFTKRAFLNGRLDLTQVEAVADIIHSLSVPGIRTAARQLNGEFTQRLSLLRKQLLDVASLLELELDFADEDLEFTDRKLIKSRILEARDFCSELADSYKAAEIMRSGFFVGIVGYPNSGKSTLFNALLNRKRAIVSEIPGTTRDYLEELLYINGIAIKITDTAGLRETEDTIEIEGIRMVESVLKHSDLILVLNDISVGIEHSNNLFEKLKEKYTENETLLVQNKIDKTESENISNHSLYISAKKQIGIAELKSLLETKAKASSSRINDILVNERQAALLKLAAGQLTSAAESIDSVKENELISIDIKEASDYLGSLTGEKWSEDVLNNIFSRFCIGK